MTRGWSINMELIIGNREDTIAEFETGRFDVAIIGRPPEGIEVKSAVIGGLEARETRSAVSENGFDPFCRREHLATERQCAPMRFLPRRLIAPQSPPSRRRKWMHLCRFGPARRSSSRSIRWTAPPTSIPTSRSARYFRCCILPTAAVLSRRRSCAQVASKSLPAILSRHDRRHAPHYEKELMGIRSAQVPASGDGRDQEGLHRAVRGVWVRRQASDICPIDLEVMAQRYRAGALRQLVH